MPAACIFCRQAEMVSDAQSITPLTGYTLPRR